MAARGAALGDSRGDLRPLLTPARARADAPGRAPVLGWRHVLRTRHPAALVEYQVRFGRPVVVPDDDTGAELTVRGTVGALLDDGRARVDLTVTSGGEKVLSLARALVALS